MTRSFPNAASPKRPATSDKIVDLDAFRRSKQPPSLVKVDFGGAWYHEAAIKHERLRPHDGA